MKKAKKEIINKPGPSSSDVKKRNYPVVALSMGDKNGIGPEVLLKALQPEPENQKKEFSLSSAGFESEQKREADITTLSALLTQTGILLFGSSKALGYYSELFNLPAGQIQQKKEESFRYLPDQVFPELDTDLPKPGEIFLIPSKNGEEAIEPGSITASSGAFSMAAVSAGIDACLNGKADALVTAPISKEAINKAGYDFPGHTEYLAFRSGSTSYGMMLVNQEMRIGLVTIHLPLRNVSDALTPKIIEEKIFLFHSSLQYHFAIKNPRIAVLGLNPHAGDGGVLGTEEIEIISPLLKNIQKKGIQAEGPWPADGFFGSQSHKDFDLCLAMYHDQGLIPFKLSGFGHGVNMTCGLPFIRTSPDHGTAFALAGKGLADPSSMKSALELACSLAIKKRNLSGF